MITNLNEGGKNVNQIKKGVKNINKKSLKLYWILVIGFLMIVLFILGYLYRGFRDSNKISLSDKSPVDDSVNSSGATSVFEKEIIKTISKVNQETKEIIARITQNLEIDFNRKPYIALDKFLEEEQFNINCINSTSNSDIIPNSSWSQNIINKFQDKVVVSACKNNELGEFVTILFENPSKFVTPKLLLLDNNFNILSTTELEEVFYTNEMCGNIEVWTVNNNIKLTCKSDVMNDSSNNDYVVNIGSSEKRLLFQQWTGQTENWKYKLEINKNN